MIPPFRLPERPRHPLLKKWAFRLTDHKLELGSYTTWSIIDPAGVECYAFTGRGEWCWQHARRYLIRLGVLK
jgi:hypothetical protein